MVPRAGGDGVGCHAPAGEMERAARAAGKSEILDQYAADYPQGPHDKPQSMCPAFGSLRVGLRMRRVATVLSGSACCVYGLTFVSHFYGARRSVGYVPFNSETLVTGKLFEDIRDAVHELADPDRYDAVVVTNLFVPTASGVPLKLLPSEINGVRIVGIDVPGFGIPTHAEAKDVLAGAMLNYARAEIEAGPVQAPERGRSDRPTVALLGEMFPADPMMIGAMLSPMGLAAGPVVPCREWRELYAALDSGVCAAIHPFYTAAVREFQAAGRPVVGSAPVGHDGTALWLKNIGEACSLPGFTDISEPKRSAVMSHGGRSNDRPSRSLKLAHRGRVEGMDRCTDTRIERSVKLAPLPARHHRPRRKPHRRQHRAIIIGSAGNISPSSATVGRSDRHVLAPAPAPPRSRRLA